MGERDRARAHPVDGLGSAAELRVREHLDLDPAFGALLDALGELVGVPVLDVAF